MQDLKQRYEKVVADAAECELVGSLAVDKEKREMFRALAEQYQRMAAALKQEIERRNADIGMPPRPMESRGQTNSGSEA